MSHSDLRLTPPRARSVGARALATVLVVASVAACDEPTSTRVAADDLQSMEADNVVFGMTSYLTSSGVREGRIRADTAYIYADSAIAQLRQMEITFYDADGREIATVNGLRGRWAQESDEMVARGDVVLLVHGDSSRLESQEIHYDPSLDRIWSDSATTRTMLDGSVTSGTSFESDISFENIFIRNPRGRLGRVF